MPILAFSLPTVLLHATIVLTIFLFLLTTISRYLFKEDMDCPLCLEEIDLSDANFKPCPCGYQVSFPALASLSFVILLTLRISIPCRFVVSVGTTSSKT